MRAEPLREEIWRKSTMRIIRKLMLLMSKTMKLDSQPLFRMIKQEYGRVALQKIQKNK